MLWGVTRRNAMQRKRRAIQLAPALLLLLGGCIGPTLRAPDIAPAALETESAYQREAFLHEWQRLRLKLFRASYPLMAGSVYYDVLPTRPSIGVLLFHPELMPQHLQAQAAELWPTPQGLRIWAVAPGSPAAAAGLQTDDYLLALDGVPLPAGAQGLNYLVAHMPDDRPASLEIQRGEQHLTVEVRPQPIVDVVMQLNWREDANARATFTQIEVHAGMIRFCDTDAQLSFIIAHELAHLMLEHVRKTLLNYATGTLADAALALGHIYTPNGLGIIGAVRQSEAFEVEADYLSLYLLAQSGYDLEAVLPFWRRVGLLHPPRSANDLPRYPSHPETAERYLRMQAAIEEIHAKQDHGEPLVPQGWED